MSHGCSLIQCFIIFLAKILSTYHACVLADVFHQLSKTKKYDFFCRKNDYKKNKTRSLSDLASRESCRRRRRRGCELEVAKKKKGGGPERPSLLVLAAVAPAAHGGCGAERPIHPAHQGRTRHRKTGRKRGYSSRAHCLSDWRPGLSSETAQEERREAVQNGEVCATEHYNCMLKF